jgi:hypothetical protein
MLKLYVKLNPLAKVLSLRKLNMHSLVAKSDALPVSWPAPGNQVFRLYGLTWYARLFLVKPAYHRSLR